MATLFPLRTHRTVTIITKTSPEVKLLLKLLPCMVPPALPSPNTTPTTPQLTGIGLKSPPSFSLFLILEKHGTINKTKAFWLGVLKKSDIFPIIKNSFHLNQLQYIYLASTRHCPAALVCLGVGGLTKGRQLKMPSSSYDHQNIL